MGLFSNDMTSLANEYFEIKNKNQNLNMHSDHIIEHAVSETMFQIMPYKKNKGMLNTTSTGEKDFHSTFNYLS